MNKIKYSDKYIEWCKKFNQNPDLIYLVQCALISESEETLSVLLESLRSEEYDLVTRLVIADYEDGWVARKDIVWFFSEEVVEKKEKGKTWKDLTKALSKISIEVTERFGYFFSPKDKLSEAKHVWDTNNYNLEKTVKVITKYYENWSSEISPMGLYSLLTSPQFEINYNNFKEKDNSFWD